MSTRYVPEDVCYGIDISNWNDTNVRTLPEWIKFVAVKATQGARFVNPQMRPQMAAVLDSGRIPIWYHFLDHTAPPEEQFKHFRQSTGGFGGFGIASDFEAYGDWSPTNRDLRVFNALVADAIHSHNPDKENGTYSGEGFWEGEDSSGAFEQYRSGWLWNAQYPYDRPGAVFRDGKALYQRALRDGFMWDIRYSGKRPLIEQLSSMVDVGNHFGDFNVARLGEKALRELIAGAVKAELPDQPKRPPVDQDIDDLIRYLENTIGGPYVVWRGGVFTRRAPAWVGGHPAPPARQVRDEGAFCVALAQTLPLRFLGLPLPNPKDPQWEGGLLDYGTDYIDDMQIAVPWKPGMKLRPLDIGLTRYTGPELQNQGHMWMEWKNGRALGADVPYGINARRTFESTVRDLTHGKKVWVVRREKWMRR